MQTDPPFSGDSSLAPVRRQSQAYLGYLFWVLLSLCLLWVLDTVVSLVDRWVTMLHGIRRSVGLAVPAAGPDYWILGGVSLLALAVLGALIGLYAAYRAAWNRRLRAVWGDPPDSGHLRIHPLRPQAGENELKRRSAYLRALASSSEWGGSPPTPGGEPRQTYTNDAAAMLQALEADIARRAVAVGLVVGLNRNPLIDTLSIGASALELQLHVLTRLGKRPSVGVWIEMLKRTGASLFLNHYVSREDALYLNLAIRKAALGLTVASESLEEASGALADIDWDEVLGGVSIPGLSAVTSLTAAGVGVGAFGLRQLGSFIEATANDLLQGVLAGGILYYHGMALAADCLALDEEHRRSPEMTRTVSQAMQVACAPAGRLLRDQVRRMRELLRERRRMAISAATKSAKQGAERLRATASSTWDILKGATRLPARPPDAPRTLPTE